jgi:hypothetical protein
MMTMMMLLLMMMTMTMMMTTTKVANIRPFLDSTFLKSKTKLLRKRILRRMRKKAHVEDDREFFSSIFFPSFLSFPSDFAPHHGCALVLPTVRPSSAFLYSSSLLNIIPSSLSLRGQVHDEQHPDQRLPQLCMPRAAPHG